VRFGADAAATSVAGMAQGVIFGGALFTEASLERSEWRPTLRLGVQRAWSGTEDATNGGSARFTWTVGTLEACPVRWGRGSVSLTPCAHFDAGVLSGSGANVAVPRDDARLWLDVAAVARGQWEFLSSLYVAAEAGALVPLTRPRFHFDSPDSTVLQPSPVGAVASLALGSHFP
jgi:hypothetical protein